jgi:hypothetical protein
MGPKGYPTAPIIIGSEATDFLKLLTLIRQSDSSMIAIEVETEYRSVVRSLSGLSPKGGLNVPIVAGSEVTHFLRRIHSYSCYSVMLWNIKVLNWKHIPVRMKMSYCSVRASRALLIGHEYVSFEVVVHRLSIAQCAPVSEREPRSVPQVQPYDWTVLMFGLRWSATWLREATFCHRGVVDRWVLTERIDYFPIAMPDHADSSGFLVQISPMANPEDRVVIDGVLIGGRVGPSIGSVIAGCWNVIVEFLRPRGNLKPIIIVCRSSYCWAECSRSLSSPTVIGSVPNRKCMSVRNFLS